MTETIDFDVEKFYKKVPLIIVHYYALIIPFIIFF